MGTATIYSTIQENEKGDRLLFLIIDPPESFTTSLSAASATSGELSAKSNVTKAKSREHRVKIKSKERRAECEERRAKRIEHGAESKESFLKPMNDLFPILSSPFFSSERRAKSFEFLKS
jgi:hypothetical protein